MFDNAVAPRLAFRDKDDFCTHMQTKADEQAKTPGIAIGSPEGELIIDLEISGDTQSLPLGPKASAEGLIMLCGDCFKGDSITAGIDEMKAIEAISAGEVPGSNQVQLLHFTGPPGFEFRITRARALRQEGWTKIETFNDAIDRPDPGERIDAELAELPLDGNGTPLRVLAPKQSLSHLADESFGVLGKLSGLVEWGT